MICKSWQTERKLGNNCTDAHTVEMAFLSILQMRMVFINLNAVNDLTNCQGNTYTTDGIHYTALNITEWANEWMNVWLNERASERVIYKCKSQFIFKREKYIFTHALAKYNRTSRTLFDEICCAATYYSTEWTLSFIYYYCYCIMASVHARERTHVYDLYIWCSCVRK